MQTGCCMISRDAQLSVCRVSFYVHTLNIVALWHISRARARARARTRARARSSDRRSCCFSSELLRARAARGARRLLLRRDGDRASPKAPHAEALTSGVSLRYGRLCCPRLTVMMLRATKESRTFRKTPWRSALVGSGERRSRWNSSPTDVAAR